MSFRLSIKESAPPIPVNFLLLTPNHTLFLLYFPPIHIFLNSIMPAPSMTTRGMATERFSRSLLCRDITEGIHHLLQRKREGHAPPHESATQRYHVHVWPQRRPNGCWCEAPRTCTLWARCNKRPIPELGINTEFTTCTRDHQDSRVGCSDIHCFNPNASAVKYMGKFLQKRADGVAHLSNDQVRLIANILARYRDTFPSQYFRQFENIVHLIFQDLCTGEPLDWNAEVQGVLAWRLPPGECIIELAREIQLIATKRNLKEVRHR